MGNRSDWETTKYPGVQRRPHPTRKHGRNPDFYYRVRYRLNGKLIVEALGYASGGWSPQKAAGALAEIRENQRRGEGPQTLAEKKEAKQEQRRREAEAKVQAERDALPFERFVEDHYLPQADQDKTAETMRRERSLIAHWLSPSLGHLPIRDIRAFHIEKMKKTMADAGKAPRTIEYALALVRQIINHARREGFFCGDNPVGQVRKPKFDNGRLRFLSEEESTALLDALRDRSPQTYYIAAISLYAGLRAGEIFNLSWADLDLRGGFITVRDSKTGRNRVVPIPDTLLDILRELKPGSPGDLVFTSSKGGRVRGVSNTFDKVVERLGFNTGVEDRRQMVCFHTCRHSFASRLVAAGADLYTVQRLTGHSTFAMVQRYAHLAPDHLREAVRALDSPSSKKGTVVSMFSGGE